MASPTRYSLPASHSVFVCAPGVSWSSALFFPLRSSERVLESEGEHHGNHLFLQAWVDHLGHLPTHLRAPLICAYT